MNIILYIAFILFNFVPIYNKFFLLLSIVYFNMMNLLQSSRIKKSDLRFKFNTK
jgi:hypothetical protein